MKRTCKKILALILAAVICASTLSFSSYAVTFQPKADDTLYVGAKQNAKGGWSNISKVRMEVFSTKQLNFEYLGSAQVSVKSNKPAGLKVTINGYYDDKYEYDPKTNSYKGVVDGWINMYALKTGTYTVTVTATLSNGSKKEQKISVLVGTQTGVMKTAKLGKKTIYNNVGKVKKGELISTYSTNDYITAKSGKLKITPNTKYKITGMVVVSVNAKGKVSYKKVKNGKNITLSRGYQSKSSDAIDESSYKSCKKHTYIYVSYKDTFTGDSVTYSVSTKRGKKEIKAVYFDKQTGFKTVGYQDTATFDLWNY
ncbi:MAG: hypothetical protein J5517_04580 [Eubacterium sp.]|nr:hypothetical protein [Eubacterium sp.]